MTTAAAENLVPPAAPAAFQPPRGDFADWLSPMLVKELRQGMRTRVFVVMFILLQVFMLIDLTLSVLVVSQGASAEGGTVFFWLMVAVPTLLVLPINGLGAIGNEIRANTLELIFLTRLTALRIVVGKWFALFTQALLLVCAVLPYLVLRYFMGGVNLAVELYILGLILVGSALLIALTVGVSAFPTRLVRPLATVGGIFAFMSSFNLIGTLFFRGGSGVGLPGVWETASAAGCAAIFLLLLLEIGAVRIAPPAENHSAVMRLLGVGAWLLALAGDRFFTRPEPLTITTFAIAFVICLIAVNEQPRWIPSLYRRFAVRGWPGRLVGWLFYPGWCTGVLFLLVVFGAFAALMAHERMITTGRHWISFAVMVGAVLFPVAVVRGLFPKTTRPVVIFCVVQTVCLLLYVFCMVCDNALHTSTKYAADFLPLDAFFLSMEADSAREVRWLFAGVGTSALSVLALFVAGLGVIRQTFQMERESLQLPAPPAADTAAVAAPPSDAPLA